MMPVLGDIYLRTCCTLSRQWKSPDKQQAGETPILSLEEAGKVQSQVNKA